MRAGSNVTPAHLDQDTHDAGSASAVCMLWQGMREVVQGAMVPQCWQVRAPKETHSSFSSQMLRHSWIVVGSVDV